MCMNHRLTIKNGILPDEMHGKELEHLPRCGFCRNIDRAVEIPKSEFLGFWTAIGVIERVLQKLGPYDILDVSTPCGDSYFKANDWTSSMIVARLCQKYKVPAMTVANWLKDWKRQPLEG